MRNCSRRRDVTEIWCESTQFKSYGDKTGAFCRPDSSVRGAAGVNRCSGQANTGRTAADSPILEGLPVRVSPEKGRVDCTASQLGEALTTEALTTRERRSRDRLAMPQAGFLKTQALRRNEGNGHE